MNPEKKKAFEELSQNHVMKGYWEESTIDLFVKAMRAYLKCLEPYQKKDNEKIEKEVKDMKTLISFLLKQKTNEQSHWGGFIEIHFMKSTYMRLTDILYKYSSILNQIYREKKENVFVEGALEAEEKEIARLADILQKEPFIYDVRIKTLVPDFSGAFQETAPISPNQIGHPINIEKFYGQALFGNNYGQIIQNNYGDFIKDLQNFSTKIMESTHLTPEIKKDAMVDIQTLTAQLNKSKPDTSIMKKAYISLTVLANISQVASFVGPHLDKIQQLIDSVSHIKL